MNKLKENIRKNEMLKYEEPFLKLAKHKSKSTNRKIASSFFLNVDPTLKNQTN